MRALTLIVVAVAGLLLASASADAQPAPAQNISAKRHSNLAAAQHFVDQAFHAITIAQDANEFDMEGHASKAKALLDEANRELKAAALAANKNAK